MRSPELFEVKVLETNVGFSVLGGQVLEGVGGTPDRGLELSWREGADLLALGLGARV